MECTVLQCQCTVQSFFTRIHQKKALQMNLTVLKCIEFFTLASNCITQDPASGNFCSILQSIAQNWYISYDCKGVFFLCGSRTVYIETTLLHWKCNIHYCVKEMSPFVFQITCRVLTAVYPSCEYSISQRMRKAGIAYIIKLFSQTFVLN